MSFIFQQLICDCVLLPCAFFPIKWYQELGFRRGDNDILKLGFHKACSSVPKLGFRRADSSVPKLGFRRDCSGVPKLGFHGGTRFTTTQTCDSRQLCAVGGATCSGVGRNRSGGGSRRCAGGCS